MRRPSHEWSVCLLGSCCLMPSHCQRHQWVKVSWWRPSKRNSIKATGANFRCRGRGERWVCASCFACSWSSWAKQSSFFPQQPEEKNLSEPLEFAAEIWELRSSFYFPETIPGRGSKFCNRSNSTGFSWEVSLKWPGSTCRSIILDGFSKESVCSISLFAVFPSFLRRWTALFIVLIWFWCIYIS